MSARTDIAVLARRAGLTDAEAAMVAGQILDAYRAESLREEATNLRRIERTEIPHRALGTRTGVLKAALILDERADEIGGESR